MVKLSDIVAVSAVRTPMGSFGGTLKEVASYNLGATAIKAALERSGFKGEDLAEVIYGSCRQAGNGPNPSRSAAIFAGLPVEVPTNTLNMACPSGMKSIMLAAQGILTGQGEVYMTGGMDSMSTIPYLLKNVRFEGFKMGDIKKQWTPSNPGVSRTKSCLLRFQQKEKHRRLFSTLTRHLEKIRRLKSWQS
jgi:acetyl-CoA C-acetyltransferase